MGENKFYYLIREMKTFNLKFSIDISIDADTQLEAIKKAMILVEDISWDSKLLEIEEEIDNEDDVL